MRAETQPQSPWLEADRDKDSLTLALGWEVVHIRIGGLDLLGTYDTAHDGGETLNRRQLHWLARGPFIFDIDGHFRPA